MRLVRFRLRTLLSIVAGIALTIGGARWWYDSRIAEYEQQKEVALQLALHYDAQFKETGSGVQWLPRWLDPRLFRRPIIGYCEPVGDMAVIATHLNEFTELKRLVVLGRQLVPCAYRMRDTGNDLVIESLRQHRSLREIVVDASIRGAPLTTDIQLYTREDLALLEELLPNVQIQWIEVN
jgi:hypothetical protein